MAKIAQSLLVQACRDMRDRDNNNGDWVDGVPQSFIEIRSLLDLDDDISAISVIERVISRLATHLVADSN